MKPLRLKIDLPLDDRIHEAGAVVMVPDVRAAELIRLGHAEAQEGSPAVRNPDHNPLADCIEPEPPGGLVLNPVDASSPNVRDNPGLRKAVELGSPKVKSGKLKADQVVEGRPGVEAGDATGPATTANELAPVDDPSKAPAPLAKGT